MKDYKKSGKWILAALLAAALAAGSWTAWGTQAHAAAKKPRKITLSERNCTMFAGEKFTLKVKSVKPAGASKKVTWHTSNRRIAIVKATANGGQVTAKKKGTAAITVKSKSSPNVKATCKIKVYQATKSITFKGGNSYTLTAGEKKQLSVTTRPTGQPVTFSSKNTKVAKVDSKGKVTAVSQGKTTITAKSGRKTVKATVTVKGSSSGNVLISGVTEGLDWKLYKDGRMVISGNYKKKKWTRVKLHTILTDGKGGIADKYQDKIRSVTITAKGLTDMEGFFGGFKNLETVDLSGMDASKVTTMKDMFSNTKLKRVNMRGLNAGRVTSMWGMFMNCKNLESVDLEGIKTGSVTDMSHMFSDCGLKEVDLSSFDTRNVKKMYEMFYNSSLESINLSSFNTSGAEDMMYMFKLCRKLKRLELPPTFTGNRETNMTQMFWGCTGLEELDLGGLNLEGPKSISSGKTWLLDDCTNLKRLDLSQVVLDGTQYELLEDCVNLQSIMVPVNLKSDIYINLWVKYQDASGNIYTDLPQNVSETFEITRIKEE